MKLKRLVLLSALMLLFFNAFSQNLEVTFFELLPYDMTARSTSGKMDQNGKRCALVRVTTTDKSVSFEGGSLGIVATDPKPGEIWVWLPAHSRRITIAHPESEPLYYDFDNIELEEGCTYRLKLKTPRQQENPIVLAQKCALSVESDQNGDEVYINESDENSIEFELEIHVDYKVSISYDDYTNATYDNEDKEWYGAEFTTEHFTESGSTVVSLKFDKQSKEIEIIEADYGDLL